MISNVSGLVGIQRIPHDDFEAALYEDAITRALEGWSGTSNGYRYYAKLVRKAENMDALPAGVWTVCYCRERAAFNPYTALDTLHCVRLEVWLQEAQHGYEVWYKVPAADYLLIPGPIVNVLEPLTCPAHLLDWGRVH
jgi:hypothetical protein